MLSLLIMYRRRLRVDQNLQPKRHDYAFLETVDSKAQVKRRQQIFHEPSDWRISRRERQTEREVSVRIGSVNEDAVTTCITLIQGNPSLKLLSP